MRRSIVDKAVKFSLHCCRDIRLKVDGDGYFTDALRLLISGVAIASDIRVRMVILGQAIPVLCASHFVADDHDEDHDT